MADPVDLARTTFWLCMVAVCWGGTNPLLKRGSAGIESVRHESKLIQSLAEFWYLATRWQFAVPFIVNQAGSVLYLLTLGEAQISLVVPITNSLTFIFTGISGKLLGEKFGNRETYAGVALVILGVALCVWSKVSDGQ